MLNPFTRKQQRQQWKTECSFCHRLTPLDTICQLRIDYDNNLHTQKTACPSCAVHVRIYKRCLTDHEINKIGHYATTKRNQP